MVVVAVMTEIEDMLVGIGILAGGWGGLQPLSDSGIVNFFGRYFHFSGRNLYLFITWDLRGKAQHF